MVRISIMREMREWMGAGYASTWFLDPKPIDCDWYTLYKRFCMSRTGYFLHLLGYSIGWHTWMIFDPLHSGTLRSALKSWLYNLWRVDICGSISFRWDRWRRPEHYQKMEKFWRACDQASEEGYLDDMQPLEGFSNANFIGKIAGKRYFSRVVEILKEDTVKNSVQ